MRFVLTALLWLLTTAALVIAVPSAWAQKNLIDVDGYAAFTQQAAADPALQQAMASELSSQVVQLAVKDGSSVAPAVVGAVASAYTASSAFPGQFAQANRYAHRWMFTNSVSTSESNGRWVIDLAPMLSDRSFTETLSRYNITVPTSLPVPLTENVSHAIRPGQLRPLATWGPWVAVGSTILAGVFALLTLAAARSRGRAMAALGVSALLVGAAGWAGLEIGRRYADTALSDAGGDVRQIADALLRHATDSMHQWLNVLLLAGGGLVLVGVLLAALGARLGGQRSSRQPVQPPIIRQRNE